LTKSKRRGVIHQKHFRCYPYFASTRTNQQEYHASVLGPCERAVSDISVVKQKADIPQDEQTSIPPEARSQNPRMIFLLVRPGGGIIEVIVKCP